MNIQSPIIETTALRLLGLVAKTGLAGATVCLFSRSCSFAAAGLERYFPKTAKSVKYITDYAVGTPFYTAFAPLKRSISLILPNLAQSGAIFILASIVSIESCPFLLPFPLILAIGCWILYQHDIAKNETLNTTPKIESKNPIWEKPTPSINQEKNERMLEILRALSELKEVYFPASFFLLDEYKKADHIAETLAKKLPDLKGVNLENALEIFIKLFTMIEYHYLISEKGEKFVIDAVLNTLTGDLLWSTLARLNRGEHHCPRIRACTAEAAANQLPNLEGVGLKNALFVLVTQLRYNINVDGNRIANVVLKTLSRLKDDDLKNAFQVLSDLVFRRYVDDQETEDSIAKAVLKKLPDLKGETLAVAIRAPIILLSNAIRTGTMKDGVVEALLNALPRMEKKDLPTLFEFLSSLKGKKLVSEEIKNLITAAELKYK